GVRELPLIVLLVLYHDEGKWQSPTSLHDLFPAELITAPAWASITPSFRSSSMTWPSSPTRTFRLARCRYWLASLSGLCAMPASTASTAPWLPGLACFLRCFMVRGAEKPSAPSFATFTPFGAAPLPASWPKQSPIQFSVRKP